MNDTPENTKNKESGRGTTGASRTGASQTGVSRAPASNSQNSESHVKSKTIPVIEEKLQVGKEFVETGKVRISKRIHEEEETIGVPLSQEEVSIERVPVNKYVDTAPPGIRQEGDTTIISVLKEVTVVEKRLMLVEEVHIRKDQKKSTSEQKVTLRKEEVIVDRQKGDSDNQ